MNITEFIQSLGLSETEGRVFDVLINSGGLSVTEIARRAQIKRPLAYYSAEKLVDAGLARGYEKRKIKHFRPSNPRNLERLVEKKEFETKELSRTFQNLLPQVVSLYSSRTDRPLFTVYSGMEGIRRIYKNILQEADELLIFTAPNARANSQIDILVREQIKKQEERGINVKAIVSARRPNSSDNVTAGTSIQIRTLPADELTSNTQIFVWKDTVALNTIDEKMISTLIRNEEIAQTFRAIFFSLWKRSDEADA